VIGGDVLPGPMPRETLALLRGSDLPVRYIRGNGDRETLAERAGAGTSTVPEQFRPAIRWTAEQLDAEDAAWIASWPETLRVDVPGLGAVLFCHATPRNDTDIVLRTTPEAPLLPLFAGVDASLVVCGHTHMPFDRMVGSVRLVNAGSVGMPFGAPGADWLLLGPDVQPRHTRYDLVAAADRIRATAYPQADDFASRNVLQPPSESEILAAFSRVEVR
jgi:predicted phosphodiesterase